MTTITYKPCPKCGTEVSMLFEVGEVEAVCDSCVAESYGVLVESVEYLTDLAWSGRTGPLSEWVSIDRLGVGGAVKVTPATEGQWRHLAKEKQVVDLLTGQPLEWTTIAEIILTNTNRQIIFTDGTKAFIGQRKKVWWKP